MSNAVKISHSTSLELSTRAIKQAIARHFDYGFDFEFQNCFEKVLARTDSLLDDDLVEEAYNTLIFESERWMILKRYCIAEEANWELAWEAFLCDLLEIADSLRQLAEEDE